MSLSFDFSKCSDLVRNNDENGSEKYGWQMDAEGVEFVAPISKAITLSTISVGIGQITDKNVEEFYARLILLDRVWGIATFKVTNPDYDPDTVENLWIDYVISPDDVRQHIGLFTNVRNETRVEWCRRMFQNKGTSVLRDFMQDYHRGIDKADKIREANKQEV